MRPDIFTTDPLSLLFLLSFSLSLSLPLSFSQYEAFRYVAYIKQSHIHEATTIVKAVTALLQEEFVELHYSEINTNAAATNRCVHWRL